ncbi:MAG: hypothetical protein EHM47_14305, partial [Ignavibacteriales bacterium]
MKRLFALLPVFIVTNIFISCSTSPGWSGTFDFYPEKPEPGDEITVFYNADSTKLALHDSIEMMVYLYNVKLDNTLGVEMKKVDKGWEGRIKTNKDTKGLLIKFKDEDIFDNNEKKGYVIHLYDGENIVPGSIAGLGGAVLNWGSYYLDLERDFKLSVKYFEEDFNHNPEIKNEYLDAYLLAYSQVYPEFSDSVVKNELIKLESKGNLTEENLAALSDWYGRTGDENKAEKYKNILREKFPDNENIQLALYREIQAEQDIDKRKELVDKFEKDFHESKYLNSAYDLIAIYYRDNRMYDKALDFFRKNSNKTTIFRFYSVTQKMFKENADTETALQI